MPLAPSTVRNPPEQFEAAGDYRTVTRLECAEADEEMPAAKLGMTHAVSVPSL